jgi:hypothetical protein
MQDRVFSTLRSMAACYHVPLSIFSDRFSILSQCPVAKLIVEISLVSSHDVGREPGKPGAISLECSKCPLVAWYWIGVSSKNSKDFTEEA